MGEQIKARLQLAGRWHEGQAQLESQEIRFRGDTRLVLPLAELKAVQAKGEQLVMMRGDERVVLTLGPRAEKWAQRINNPKTVVEKLGLKSGQRIWLVGTRQPSFLEELAKADIEANLSASGDDDCDAIFLTVTSRALLDRIPRLVTRLAAHGALWILRPKGSKTLSEADVRDAARKAGLVDVKVVSFSEELTADKFVIPRAQRARKSAAER